MLMLACTALVLSCEDADRKRVIRSAPLLSSHFQDDAGHTLSYTKSPERILSLAPSLTEIIYAIGAGPQLVARTSACNYPEEVMFVPALDLENGITIDSLKSWNADLILFPEGFYSAVEVNKFAAQGLPVFVVKSESLADVYRSIRLIGAVLGRSEAAGFLADSLQEMEQKISARTENLVHYGTILLLDGNPLTVAGGSGLFQELIHKAGGKNAFEEIQSPIGSVTEEEIFAKKPEYLLLPSREPQVYQLLIERYPSIYSTPAGALSQVFVINPDWVYRPGPRIIEGLRQMAQALHSEMVEVE